MNRHTKQLVFFLLAAAALFLYGCALGGNVDVNFYSPDGDANAISKQVDADSNVGLK